ncbi:conserved hypothetical protein [Magnetococcus marinus MC-1]|uniref:DUF3800 domain-containing protein n=1 Tax=Magnetococcus marinus (strain ATCC BAA-1437 / JCM 17883 / MC-1) TaxID=156889 RepID=A0L977_MAGMM|nr:DUF3800 domain-containing protein [Magnetococcus marinus]ABK44520.1 conserved hypothetical protein [Magnetococcus marinus MC-1]
MEFDVYCDESRPDLLTSQHPKGTYVAIGSLWIETLQRKTCKDAIHSLRDTYRVGGEFKWQKVSPSRVEFYKALIDWFMGQGASVRFRCILIRHDQINWQLHSDDRELGFYKFYYQLLHHWVLDFNRYSVFCDYKSNRLMDRPETLRRCLSSANLSSDILRVQPVRSEESVLIQAADVLTGAVSAKFNKGLAENGAKSQLIEHLENRLGHPLTPTVRGEKKFNIFAIDLGGGW